MSATTTEKISLGSVLQTLFNERAFHAELLLKKLDVIEEKDNTIRQLEDKLSQFQAQYQDYKATCTKIIDGQRAENLELRDKLRVKDDKIEELSTKLAEVVVSNKKHDDEVEYWKDIIDRKNGYIDELHEQIEELESITGYFKRLKDEIEKLKDRLSSTSDKVVSKGPDKMPDYEGFRKKADEAQRKMMEVWEAFFNE
jgi:chromosome segregation ATPase